MFRLNPWGRDKGGVELALLRHASTWAESSAGPDEHAVAALLREDLDPIKVAASGEVRDQE